VCAAAGALVSVHRRLESVMMFELYDFNQNQSNARRPRNEARPAICGERGNFATISIFTRNASERSINRTADVAIALIRL
jgi:hypothetical protein